MLVGYARVSTQDQDTALQLDALARLGCATVFQEKASGSSRRGRPELARCLSSLRKGDTLVVYKIDRIARSLFDLLDVLRCWRRSKSEPPCRVNSEPGVEADA